jgi:DNA-binding HxlR family transcriptional regulator
MVPPAAPGSAAVRHLQPGESTNGYEAQIHITEATMSTYDVFLADCPARTTLELISDTWSVVVLVGLAHGPRRYSWLLGRAGGISKKMLSQTLRKLTESGLIARPVVRGGEYALTDLGESLLGPLTALTAWAEQHTDDLVAAIG